MKLTEKFPKSDEFKLIVGRSDGQVRDWIRASCPAMPDPFQVVRCSSRMEPNERKSWSPDEHCTVVLVSSCVVVEPSGFVVVVVVVVSYD